MVATSAALRAHDSQVLRFLAGPVDAACGEFGIAPAKVRRIIKAARPQNYHELYISIAAGIAGAGMTALACEVTHIAQACADEMKLGEQPPRPAAKFAVGAYVKTLAGHGIVEIVTWYEPMEGPAHYRYWVAMDTGAHGDCAEGNVEPAVALLAAE